MSRKFKILLITITILLVGSILLGTSYSLWNESYVQEEANEVNVGCFTITFTNVTSYGGTEAGDLSLSNAYPITEASGSSKTPYMFKLHNNCTVPSKYTINLETLSSSTFNVDYLRVKFNKVNTNTTSSLYKDLTNGTIVLTGQSSTAKELITGSLRPDQEVTYELRVWIDIDATTDTPNVMGKTWNGKVVVSSEASKLEYPTLIEKVRSIVEGESTSSTDVIDKGNGNTLAYDGTTDNNLRYVGANPSNYVQFNGELWRIIGIMNNMETGRGTTESLIKLRRADSLGSYSWDTSEASINSGYGVNEWSQADIMQELNNDYLGNITIGTNGKWYGGSSNSKTVAIPETSINATDQEYIETVVWKTAAPNNNNGSVVTYSNSSLKPLYVYEHERTTYNGKTCSSEDYCTDTVARTTSWTGKIGLFYPSDFLYATAGGTTTTRSTCLNTYQSSWNSSDVSDCKDNDWLFDSTTNQSTMSPLANATYGSYVFYVRSTGAVRNNSGYTAAAIRPTLYLKSSTLVMDGTGTQIDPYILY